MLCEATIVQCFQMMRQYHMLVLEYSEHLS